MQEVFSYSVDRLDADGHVGSGMAGDGGDSLSTALERAFSFACFYMGEGGCRVQVSASCAECKGQGVIGGTVRRKGRTCKACKGKPTRELASFVAEPSKECEIWRHGERVSAPQTELDRREIRETKERRSLEGKALALLERSTLSALGMADQLGLPHEGGEARARAVLESLERREQVESYETTDGGGRVKWFRLPREAARAS